MVFKLGKHTSIFLFIVFFIITAFHMEHFFHSLRCILLWLCKAAAIVNFLHGSELAKANLCHSSSLCHIGSRMEY